MALYAIFTGSQKAVGLMATMVQDVTISRLPTSYQVNLQSQIAFCTGARPHAQVPRFAHNMIYTW